MQPPAFNQNFDALGIELTHHMPDDGSGVYIKETRIPAGTALEMHTHTFTHKSVLCCGRVRVTVNGHAAELTGPAVLTVRRGEQHRVEALTDATWLCVHATDECDPEAIDHTLVEVANV